MARGKRGTGGAGKVSGTSTGSSAAADMTPFADDTKAVTIGEFTVENGKERVSMSGPLDITWDKAGLDRIRKLKAIVDAIETTMASAPSLPDKTEAAGPTPSGTIKNPLE